MTHDQLFHTYNPKVFTYIQSGGAEPTCSDLKEPSRAALSSSISDPAGLKFALLSIQLGRTKMKAPILGRIREGIITKAAAGSGTPWAGGSASLATSSICGASIGYGAGVGGLACDLFLSETPETTGIKTSLCASPAPRGPNSIKALQAGPA
jgi:hypothetical protein